jgi:hypothetical protein
MEIIEQGAGAATPSMMSFSGEKQGRAGIDHLRNIQMLMSQRKCGKAFLTNTLAVQ